MQEGDKSQRVYYASSVIEVGTVKDSTTSTSKENENESPPLLVAATDIIDVVIRRI